MGFGCSAGPPSPACASSPTRSPRWLAPPPRWTPLVSFRCCTGSARATRSGGASSRATLGEPAIVARVPQRARARRIACAPVHRCAFVARGLPRRAPRGRMPSTEEVAPRPLARSSPSSRTHLRVGPRREGSVPATSSRRVHALRRRRRYCDAHKLVARAPRRRPPRGSWRPRLRDRCSDGKGRPGTALREKPPVFARRTAAIVGRLFPAGAIASCLCLYETPRAHRLSPRPPRPALRELKSAKREEPPSHAVRAAESSPARLHEALRA